MTSSLEKEILRILKENKEASEHAILLARQSTPDSLSPMLKEIRKDIAENRDMTKRFNEEHKTDVSRIEQKIDDMKPKIDLIYPKVTGDIRREEIWAQIRGMFKSGSGVILTVAATGAAIVVITGWGRQTLIHWLRQ